MKHLFPASCAVHLGGFIKSGIHIGDGRQQQNRIIAHSLPYIGTDNDGTEIFVAHQKGRGIRAEKVEHSISDDTVISENFQYHAGKNCPGKEIGDEYNGLHRSLKPAFRHLI